ncbi:MAG TPA: hypothetical protein VK858_07085 [Longimicrobiales bacterium]|nr:hypothetical protein [Longimicrobiales bacterium]
MPTPGAADVPHLDARRSDELLLTHRGAAVAVGAPADVRAPGRIGDTFGVESVVPTDPVGGTPMIIATGASGPDAFDTLSF